MIYGRKEQKKNRQKVERGIPRLSKAFITRVNFLK
jgi:hypothetical protein